MHLSGLYVYPIKSCRGIAVDAIDVDARGIARDRRLMLVDESGEFLSQRDLPAMALVEPRFECDGTIVVEAAGHDPLVVRPRPVESTTLATVWNDRVSAVDEGDEAARWFSRVLETPCRLVRQADDDARAAERGGVRSQVGFADGYPFLLLTEASLDDLNARLAAPVPLDRFRPNLAIAGASPFEEDTWRTIRIGEVVFEVVKPCARCSITTVDQATGSRGKEPLRTLATYRGSDEGVLFGQNLIHRNTGRLAVGQPVEVLARKSD